MSMTKLPLEVPISIFAAGCIICVLAGLGAFSTAVDMAMTEAMIKIGFSIGLTGAGLSLIIFLINKMNSRRAGN
ncbi:MAG: hypothetical protein HW386_1243 [Gammaproteobacteria bacterium]|nr:hypothetical protein [Gammaproteobacteria bacterium]